MTYFFIELTTAIHNKNLFAELKNSENQLYALLDLIRSIKQSIDQKISMSSLMFQITRRTHEFVGNYLCFCLISPRPPSPLFESYFTVTRKKPSIMFRTS
jgi:hypothetical protein